jgi:hypothetical protein
MPYISAIVFILSIFGGGFFIIRSLANMKKNVEIIINGIPVQDCILSED